MRYIIEVQDQFKDAKIPRYTLKGLEENIFPYFIESQREEALRLIIEYQKGVLNPNSNLDLTDKSLSELVQIYRPVVSNQ